MTGIIDHTKPRVVARHLAYLKIGFIVRHRDLRQAQVALAGFRSIRPNFDGTNESHKVFERGAFFNMRSGPQEPPKDDGD